MKHHLLLLPSLFTLACSPVDDAKTATPWPVLEGAVGQGACTPGSSPARCRPLRCLELVEYEAFNQFDLVSRCEETMYFVLPLELLWEDDKGPFDRGVESNLMGGHLWARRNGARIALTTQDTFLLAMRKEVSLVLPLPFGTREEAERATFEGCGRYCAHPDAVPCATKPDFLYLEDVVVLSGERFMTSCPNFSEGRNVIR